MRIEMSLNVLKLLNQEIPTTTQTITSKLNISSSTVDYVVKRLKACNVIKTKRGYGGGFLLAKPYEKILIGDIAPLLNTKDVFYLALVKQLKAKPIAELDGFSSIA